MPALAAHPSSVSCQRLVASLPDLAEEVVAAAGGVDGAYIEREILGIMERCAVWTSHDVVVRAFDIDFTIPSGFFSASEPLPDDSRFEADVQRPHCGMLSSGQRRLAVLDTCLLDQLNKDVANTLLVFRHAGLGLLVRRLANPPRITMTASDLGSFMQAHMSALGMLPQRSPRQIRHS